MSDLESAIDRAFGVAPEEPAQRGPGAETLSRVRIVLCRTRKPENLGAIARALRSTGLFNWTLVDPQVDPRDPEAERVAVHSAGMLQLVQVVPTLADAVKGCRLVIATTGVDHFDRPPLTPRETGRALAASEGEVALVFGDERAGLTLDEVEACDLVTTIPSTAEQPSWNLAQAVAVYAYELRQSALDLEASPQTAAMADAGAVVAIDRVLAPLLDQLGFNRIRRLLARTFQRAPLGRREAALWVAVLKRLHELLHGSAPAAVTKPPKEKRSRR